jgi:hypothetical protein
MPSAHFNEVLSRVFARRLEPLGFEPCKGTRWVSSHQAPIRRIFALSGLKGLSTAPLWGFSFDFVPHLAAGDEIRWHRTAKSAWFDLSYDPIDYTREPRSWSLSRFDPIDTLEARAQVLAIRSVESATSFWARIRTMEDVPRAFEEWRDRPFVRFGFANYGHAWLAYAFVLARLGRRGEALEWLERYLERDIREEAKPLLRRRLDEVHGAVQRT